MNKKLSFTKVFVRLPNGAIKPAKREQRDGIHTNKIWIEKKLFNLLDDLELMEPEEIDFEHLTYQNITNLINGEHKLRHIAKKDSEIFVSIEYGKDNLSLPEEYQLTLLNPKSGLIQFKINIPNLLKCIRHENQ